MKRGLFLFVCFCGALVIFPSFYKFFAFFHLIFILFLSIENTLGRVLPSRDPGREEKSDNLLLAVVEVEEFSFRSRRFFFFHSSPSLEPRSRRTASRRRKKTFVFIWNAFPVSFTQTDLVFCISAVNMVCSVASSKERVEKAGKQRRRGRTENRRRRCCGPPMRLFFAHQKKKNNPCSPNPQALSLEGLKRVAKELRDLVERPEDGIWVSI